MIGTHHRPALPQPDTRRSELGDFLRSRRERLHAETLGLSDRRRRRTPGLRREEVAELAGIGVDWYIRLEQGRAVSPSVTTVDALARALRLDSAEHAHLRALARAGDPRPFSIETVSDRLHRLVEDLRQPAYVSGRRWDVLAWNAAAADILSDFGRMAPEDRNILLFMLTDPEARDRFAESWASEARRMVAVFRATHDLWAGDPAFDDLLGRLRRGSAEFATWWEAHDVGGSGGGSKLLRHPRRGLLHFEHSSFQANENPALRLVIYTLL